MITKNDLQQIRNTVREELEPVKKEQRSMKIKLNRIAKDVHYIVGDFDTRIVENARGIKKIKEHIGITN